MKILKQMLRKKYGFLPEVTQYKGKIYISDPYRPSEPWEVYDNEYDMYNQIKE